MGVSPKAVTRRAALILPDTLSVESWSEIGHEIAIISDASAWWLADWLIYGQRKYPNRYRKAIEDTSLDYQTLRNYAWVARRFPVSRRRDKLSFQHHAEVASLPEHEQDLWLERAQRFGWSKAMLRREVRRARNANGDADNAVRAQVFKLQIELKQQDLWQAAASREGYPLDEWVMLVLDRAAGEILAPRDVTATSQAVSQVGTSHDLVPLSQNGVAGVVRPGAETEHGRARTGAAPAPVPATNRWASRGPSSETNGHPAANHPAVAGASSVARAAADGQAGGGHE
ncbi:LmbU family transcriptional regulator [Nonomuraea sp. NPDC003707]